MIKIQIILIGVSPIMMNPMTQETLNDLFAPGNRRKSANNERTAEEVAQSKVIKDGNGVIGLPAEYLFSCLNNAGRMVKYDTKKSMATADSSLIPSFLSIDQEFLPFENQGEQMMVDQRRGVLKSGKSPVAVCIVRPKFKNWKMKLSVSVDEKQVNVAKIRELFDKAGTAIGLADFRPQKRGPFGRFAVESWVEVVEKPASNGVEKKPAAVEA